MLAASRTKSAQSCVGVLRSLPRSGWDSLRIPLSMAIMIRACRRFAHSIFGCNGMSSNSPATRHRFCASSGTVTFTSITTPPERLCGSSAPSRRIVGESIPRAASLPRRLRDRIPGGGRSETGRTLVAACIIPEIVLILAALEAGLSESSLPGWNSFWSSARLRRFRGRSRRVFNRVRGVGRILGKLST